MKRIKLIILIAVMIAACTACGNDEDESTDNGVLVERIDCILT